MVGHTGRGEMRRSRGFTLIELLVVLTVVAMLLSIVAPRFIRQTDKAKEAALRENLAALRVAIDQYYGDRGQYPVKLEQLVEGRYLRRLPLDPITNISTSWKVLTSSDDGVVVIHDVKSGALGNAMDGSAYSAW